MVIFKYIVKKYILDSCATNYPEFGMNDYIMFLPSLFMYGTSAIHRLPPPEWITNDSKFVAKLTMLIYTLEELKWHEVPFYSL